MITAARSETRRGGDARDDARVSTASFSPRVLTPLDTLPLQELAFNTGQEKTFSKHFWIY